MLNMKNLTALEKKLLDHFTLSAGKLNKLLEIGCGDGRNLLYLKNHYSVDVFGIDVHEPYISQLKKQDVSVAMGDARELSFSENFFDWVLMANSLHHMPNPHIAMREAFRVAKNGVVVIDPWFDTSLVSQQLGAEISTWFTKLHQSLGYFHRTGLSAGEIIALVNVPILSIEVSYELVLERRDIAAALQEQKEYIDRLSDHHYLLWELEQIKEKLQNKFVSQPGAVMVIIKKRPSP